MHVGGYQQDASHEGSCKLVYSHLVVVVRQTKRRLDGAPGVIQKGSILKREGPKTQDVSWSIHFPHHKPLGQDKPRPRWRMGPCGGQVNTADSKGATALSQEPQKTWRALVDGCRVGILRALPQVRNKQLPGDLVRESEHSVADYKRARE